MGSVHVLSLESINKTMFMCSHYVCPFTHPSAGFRLQIADDALMAFSFFSIKILAFHLKHLIKDI